MNSLEKANSNFEVAKLHADRGDFPVAVKKLVDAAEVYLAEKQFDDYLECQNILLKIYGEQEQFDKINATKELLQDLVIQEGFSLNSRTYYTLGVCATYKKQFDVARDYFEKALKIGLEKDEKKDICYAIHGIAIVYWMTGRHDEALKELYNLQVFFQLIELPELKMASLLVNGHILNSLKKHDQALDVFWQAYDELKDTKNLYMYVSLLYAMGITYLDAGDLNLGRMYLNLAKRSIDPKSHTLLLKRINSYLEDFGGAESVEYDLVLTSSDNQLTERKKGKVEFKNQFILLDLLRLFMQNPGSVFSKEELVKKVWRQEYDPAVHDNKVYVTIKRLRKLVEPDYDKPKYIFRSKNGYFLNKTTRVMIN